MKINTYKSLLTITVAFGLQLLLAVHATTIAIPTPEKAIIKATFVASGHIQKRDKDFYFIPADILKGDGNAKEYKIAAIVIGELFPPSLLADAAKGEEILFVGKIDHLGPTLKPVFGMYSVWPNGTPETYLKFRTLDECKSFARKVMEEDSRKNSGNPTVK